MMTINPASQVIAALLIGLLIVFTCQLLLMNLGLALGITIWGGSSWTQDNDSGSEDNGADDSETGSISLGTLSIAAGLGLLLTVNGVLFVACYGAVKFCAPATAFSGGMLGWVIWSAYMLLMTWVSTRAANSLIAFILSSAVSGLRQIFAVLGSLMQATFGDQEAPLTSAATAELVRRETQLALERINIPTLIEDYIDEQMPPKLQLETLQPQLEDTLQKSDLGSLEQSGFLSHINLSTFVQWVKDEVGLSGDGAEAIAELLNQVWQRLSNSRSSPLEQLQELFSTASMDELIPERVSHLLASLQSNSGRHSETFIVQESDHANDLDHAEHAKSSENANIKINIKNGLVRQLKQILRQRLDLTDLDLQTIWHRISPLLQDWQPDETLSPDLGNQLIHDDVDDYLQQVLPWRLQHETLQQEFQEVLVDPDAAIDQVLPQLQALSPRDFTHSLRQRGDLTPDQINERVATLEAIRQYAIASLKKSATANQRDEAVDAHGIDTRSGAFQASEQETEAIAEVQKKLANYLHYTSLSKITSEAIAHKVKTLVAESPLPPETLHQTSPYLPSSSLAEVIDSRRGLDSDRRNQLMQQVQEAWQHCTVGDEAVDAEVTVAIEGTLILAISQLIGSNSHAQDLLPKLMESLEAVISDPKALRRSLSQINWQAVSKNAQMQLDASAAQIEQTVQNIQLALMGFLKPPKRWALRRSADAKDFWDNVTEYLSHSHSNQLSPTAIRHNLEWLWQVSYQGLDPLQRIQNEAIAEISKIDWGTFKAVLAHRQDLATDEIEAIWETLEAFMQSLLQQVNQARQQAQATLESWLASVKAILPDPDQLTFDASRLKADLQRLLQTSPDIFAALIHPLTSLNAAEDSVAAIAQLSQDTLKQLLSEQGVPNALLTQAEGLQTWMQARVAAIEQDLQDRQTALKQTTLQQLDDARKALATAAWWLFAIAITSGTTATIAGILAVTGFNVIWAMISETANFAT
ncbi:MAG: hypothetical protein AAF327_11350 [Cyanobacteria bacterium P01_A01_bin.37]